ncbi:MAG: LamG domain-containing protein, partial [Verrucomicrobiota bacterium]
GNRQLDFLFQQGGDNDTVTLGAGNGTIIDGDWTHVAVTAIKEGAVLFYVNGENVGESATNEFFGATNTSPFFIGNRADKTTTDFQGVIDDVALFNRVLSANEIIDIMGGEFGGPGPGVETQPFSITNLTRNSSTGELSLAWDSVPGARYALEFSSDLLEWTALTPAITADSDSAKLIFTPTDELNGFFRIRLNP